MNYKPLIQKIKQELGSKKSPGIILNNQMENKLKELADRYPHNEDLLWLGAYLADIRIDEAIAAGDIGQHVDMALEYFSQLSKEEEIPDEDTEIITEIISTHHGGEQKYIESKLFKNADNFKFLEPKGLLHLFSAYYTETSEEAFETAAKRALAKLEEKIRLADLDDQLVVEAKELYKRNKWIFDRMGIKLT